MFALRWIAALALVAAALESRTSSSRGGALCDGARRRPLVHGPEDGEHPYALRFLLATDPDAATRVLGTVYRTISGLLLCKAGHTRATGHTGAVTLIQRFGSSLNLNIHFHMIFVAGVYLPVEGGTPWQIIATSLSAAPA